MRDVRNGPLGEPESTPRFFSDLESGETKAKILDATFRRLAITGYGALSIRDIAKDAGVNHALINYHFRTKDQLVIAVLDEANRQLLDILAGNGVRRPHRGVCGCPRPSVAVRQALARSGGTSVTPVERCGVEGQINDVN